MTRKAIDLTGKRFGFLEVIKRNGSEPKRSGSLWLCKCDCGILTTTRSSFLRRGVTKSCGCYRDKHLIKFETALNTLFFIYGKDAKKRGYDFNLDLNEFEEITKSKCFYCGVDPSLIYKHRKNISDDRGYIYNGIDRKNNSKGYTIENSVPCCKTCNVMKGAMDLKEWDEWREKIAMQWLHSKRKKRSKS
jgi:5-methylcytosine-specific restriction endonuclease McrA